MSSEKSPTKPTRSKLRRFVTFVVFPLLLAIGLFVGAASALWTTNSEPWAEGQTATMQHPTASAEVVKPLYGGYSENVTLTLTNPNPVAVKVTGISHNGWQTTDERLKDFLQNTLTPANAAVVIGQVLAPNATKTFTLKEAVGLSSTVDDARQGKTFKIGYFIAYEQVAGTEVPAGSAG